MQKRPSRAVADGFEDAGSGLLDVVQRLGQRLAVAVVELDVVGECAVGVEANGLRDDKGNSFSLAP